MPTTYAQALAKIGTELPAHLVAEAEIPVRTGPQAQGDLLIVPINSAEKANWVGTPKAVPDAGVQVVSGEATGNTHWLHRGFDSPGVKWLRTEDDPNNLRIGIVIVPEGQTAELIHTDEHGANAIGPGCYAIHGKREQAAMIRRVLD